MCINSNAVFYRFGRGLQDGISVWLYEVGREFQGVLGASTLLIQGESVTIVGEPFLLTYKKEMEKLAPRFEIWLERSLIEAIWKWRSSL